MAQPKSTDWFKGGRDRGRLWASHQSPEQRVSFVDFVQREGGGTDPSSDPRQRASAYTNAVAGELTRLDEIKEAQSFKHPAFGSGWIDGMLRFNRENQVR
jgi:hypothetical protein